MFSILKLNLFDFSHRYKLQVRATKKSRTQLTFMTDPKAYMKHQFNLTLHTSLGVKGHGEKGEL